ncbi:hypothetical protein [Catellatospora citrea]|uniref:Uncharacterized protein n=1 Tax=Catellatospora citrea TaxID=53366 RepID=A0A8J3KFK0_9ACTN|nr:hypothetical protein [Catellatospora citrea]RKE12786.1 hypothetical protein C8E86_7730 [Catellatospora citrea]GIF95973.1 hypothetical protein Cci01nite_10670 [Catellatospora citrea]
MADQAKTSTGHHPWSAYGVLTAVVLPLLAISASIVVGIITANAKARASSVVVEQRAAQEASAARSAAQLDQCLVGLWRLHAADAPISIVMDGAVAVPNAARTGAVTMRFGGDGRGSVEFAYRLTGIRADDGKRMEQALLGHNEFTYQTDGGMVTLAQVSEQSAMTTTADGRQVDQREIPWTWWLSSRYVCSPTQLTTQDANETVRFERV